MKPGLMAREDNMEKVKSRRRKETKFVIVEIILIVAAICGLSTCAMAGENLMLFCGAGFKQPIEEVVQMFMKTSGIELHANYASIGALYSQILLSRQGDLFIVPSPT